MAACNQIQGGEASILLNLGGGAQLNQQGGRTFQVQRKVSPGFITKNIHRLTHLHPRSAMVHVKKIHAAPHPSTRTNPAAKGAARTRRVTRPCGNVWCLHHRSCLLLNGQRRSLTSRGLPRLLMPPPRASTAVPLDTSADRRPGFFCGLKQHLYSQQD